MWAKLNRNKQHAAAAAAAAAKSLQSCPTLCDPIDSSPPGSPIPGILQARTLEWVDISFSNSWKWKVKGKLLSRVWPLATPWTAAHQAPPSMGFSRQSAGVGCHRLLRTCLLVVPKTQESVWIFCSENSSSVLADTVATSFYWALAMWFVWTEMHFFGVF